MKILFLNSVYGEKSTGKICLALCERINQIPGYEAITVYGRGRSGKEHGVKVGNQINTVLSCAKARIFDNDGRTSRGITKRIIDVIKNFQPNIVHIHNLHGYYVNYEMLLSFLAEARIQTYITLHDSWLYTGHCCYYLYSRCEKWKTHCEKCPSLRSYPASFFLDSSSKNFERKKRLFGKFEKLVLISPSNWLVNECKKSFLQRFPAYVVPNGIDLSVFYPRERMQEDEQRQQIFLLGVNAVWDFRKGIDSFIFLAKRLPKKYHITIIGKISNKRKKKEAEDAGIMLVEFVSSQNKLAEMYSNSDLLINPTLEDNYPTTCLEAIACGTPAICFASGGTAETIPDGCGVSIPANNELLLSTILAFTPCRITISPELVKKLSAETQIRRYIQLYENNNS